MRSLIALLALFCLAEAKPMNLNAKRSSGVLGVDHYIIGGTEATSGAWPWQLSQTRGAINPSHSCGASLLSANKVLSASHCIDGASPNQVQIIAGLHTRSNPSSTNAQTVDVDRIVMHASYDDGSASFANDIALIYTSTDIMLQSNIAFATLPPDNRNQFVGDTCIMTGWGRTSTSNDLPDNLMQAPIQVISTVQCNILTQDVSGTVISDNHICLYDTNNNIGSCNGDSGGPVNCPTGSGGYYVAGVTSFGISTILGNCLQTYPSVYTRTSAYLGWIAGN